MPKLKLTNKNAKIPQQYLLKSKINHQINKSTQDDIFDSDQESSKIQKNVDNQLPQILFKQSYQPPKKQKKESKKPKPTKQIELKKINYREDDAQTQCNQSQSSLNQRKITIISEQKTKNLVSQKPKFLKLSQKKQPQKSPPDFPLKYLTSKIDQKLFYNIPCISVAQQYNNSLIQDQQIIKNLSSYDNYCIKIYQKNLKSRQRKMKLYQKIINSFQRLPQQYQPSLQKFKDQQLNPQFKEKFTKKQVINNKKNITSLKLRSNTDQNEKNCGQTQSTALIHLKKSKKEALVTKKNTKFLMEILQQPISNTKSDDNTSFNILICSCHRAFLRVDSLHYNHQRANPQHKSIFQLNSKSQYSRQRNIYKNIGYELTNQKIKQFNPKWLFKSFEVIFIQKDLHPIIVQSDKKNKFHFLEVIKYLKDNQDFQTFNNQSIIWNGISKQKCTEQNRTNIYHNQVCLQQIWLQIYHSLHLYHQGFADLCYKNMKKQDIIGLFSLGIKQLIQNLPELYQLRTESLIISKKIFMILIENHSMKNLSEFAIKMIKNIKNIAIKNYVKNIFQKFNDQSHEDNIQKY